MKFTAKCLDLTLDLEAEINGEIVKKSYKTQERITASFSSKVVREIELYIEGQKSLPDEEQEKVFEANLKFLSWVYKDLDTKWIKENFNFTEITEIKQWVFNGLNGIKKDGES